MGFDEGRIVVDSENCAYYAGQTVHCKLIFDQDKVKTFRGIYARLKGYCETHWTTTHTRRVNDRTETYHEYHGGHEVYIEAKTYLVGGESGEHSLKPGHYEFPFFFNLPGNCPSSFEGSKGHVRYEIKVVVDRAFKLDQEKKALIRVIAPYNLNNDPYAREPMEFEFNDTYCCWCMNRGSSETVVKLPVSGYCPGQVIPIEVGCTNNSSVKIDTIQFIIKREITFRADDGNTRNDEDTVAKIKKGPVAANTSRNWTVELEVPTVDVYNLNTCRFIDVDFEFKVVVDPAGCHSSTDGRRRLLLGTVPLTGFQDNITNPLQDQMPKIYEGFNTNTRYPITIQPYPGVHPSQYPGSNQPYPGGNAGYPTVTPYPSVSPYPGGNEPYPGNNQPFPGPQSYPPPYPGNDLPPYPVDDPGKTPTLGFRVGGDHKEGSPSGPKLPPGAPYPTEPIGYPAPSAPTPATPDADNTPLEKQPAFNPDVVKIN